MSRPTFPARNQWSDSTNQRNQAAQPSNTQPSAMPAMPVNNAGSVGQPGQGNADALRAHMVQQLQQAGLADMRVCQALLAVPRHCFIDSALLNQAYLDTSLPIGLQQTISKPSVVARMIELLLDSPAMRMQDPSAALGRVLEIGTGCGYQASVLGQVAQEVYSMERINALHEKARSNLRPFRVPNVHLILGDGMLGYPSGAPYAGIIAAAGGQAIPDAWIDQLATGGRIVAPLATESGQALVVIDKTAQGVQQTMLESVWFVPLKSGIT